MPHLCVDSAAFVHSPGEPVGMFLEKKGMDTQMGRCVHADLVLVCCVLSHVEESGRKLCSGSEAEDVNAVCLYGIHLNHLNHLESGDCSL